MQLRNQIVLAAANGELQPGDQLPTVRALSDESGVNAMTISKAYKLLKAEGYVNTDRRSGTVLCARQPDQNTSAESEQSLRLCLSELRLQGRSDEEILDLCRTLLKENC